MWAEIVTSGARPALNGCAKGRKTDSTMHVRVMAGGGKVPPASTTAGHVTRRRLTTGQLILLAAIVGLLIGIGAGFVSLML